MFEQGRVVALLCPDEARRRGLTIIDLSDDWAPYPLTEDPARGAVGVQPYLATYRALARGEFDESSGWARSDRYFELYGIPPALSRLRARILDQQRHDCHARLDDSALARLGRTLRQETAAQSRERQSKLEELERELETERKRRGLDTLAALAEVDDSYAARVASYEELRTMTQSITAMQQHLACDGLLDLGKAPAGTYDRGTAWGVGVLQRQHTLLPDKVVGTETREAFLVRSQEHDLRAALRVLRERVVDATGLIEDGSAIETWGMVLGRYIDGPAFRRPTGQERLADGAPDLISPATEAAAYALGWTSFDKLREFMLAHMAEGEVRMRVAVRLPALPAYHGPHMELHAVIDRGDVSNTRPNDADDGCTGTPTQRRPTLTLYALHGGRRIALIRWFTTIGGWNREKLSSGEIVMRYKASAVGRRYWRDLVAAPAWFPPATTPDDELVRGSDGDVSLKYDLFGPGYRSAYGLVMLIHHKLVQRDGKKVYADKGIRTHGSYSVNTILNGCSHGCHRLFNHQALRLASFLMHHRRFVRRGRLTAGYSREVTAHGQTLNLRLPERGYLYELVPPVIVDVTAGRIVSKAK